MVRSEQESPVPEIGTPGLMWRGLETGPWGPYTGTKLETAETAKGNLPVPRLSSTLLVGGPQETWPMVGLGPHLATERARLETPHLPVRAPGIYPDFRTLGSVRGETAGRLTDGRADLLYSEQRMWTIWLRYSAAAEGVPARAGGQVHGQGRWPRDESGGRCRVDVAGELIQDR